MKNSHPKTTPGFLLLFDIVLPARCLVAVLVVFCFPRSLNFFDGSTKSNHIVVLAGTCTHLPHHLLPCLQLHLEQLLLCDPPVLQHLHREHLGKELLDPNVPLLLHVDGWKRSIP